MRGPQYSARASVLYSLSLLPSSSPTLLHRPSFVITNLRNRPGRGPATIMTEAQAQAGSKPQAGAEISSGLPASATTTAAPEMEKKGTKLHGRAFYESIGSPKYIVAPMVDQSEFVRYQPLLFFYGQNFDWKRTNI